MKMHDRMTIKDIALKAKLLINYENFSASKKFIDKLLRRNNFIIRIASPVSQKLLSYIYTFVSVIIYTNKRKPFIYKKIIVHNLAI